MRQTVICLTLSLLGTLGIAHAEDRPIRPDWDESTAMSKVAARFHGRSGVVLHVGDSITYANPYGQWARSGKGHSAQDNAALAWMHAGKDDDADGWYLCRTDLPGGRSYTACGGIRADEMLAGGKSDMPPLDQILDRYQPQLVVLMLGTNDASAGRPVANYRADMQRIIRLMLDRGIVPIVSTIPPHPAQPQLARQYNEELRKLCKGEGVPMIDYEREILTRRPDDWNGTLLNKGDVHPTASQGGADPASEPTPENLRNSGYLLRGWLSVKKIEQVKQAVLDRVDAPPPPGGPRTSAAPDRTIWSTRSASAAHSEPREPQPGNTVRLPATRDTWFSNVGPESDGNNGGAPALKLKSIQEMSLIDVDPSPLKGRTIRSATLHLRKRGDEVLRRVTVGSFAADWMEGAGVSYTRDKGSSCFNWRQYPDVPWAYAGSDLTAVMLGQGGTMWAMADASPPDADGWMQVPVDPAVVAARVAGVSHGFLLFDDTGSEWSRQGDRFTVRHMPNRFVFSRDQRPADAPYLTVVLGPPARGAPAAPAGLRFEPSDDLPAGEAMVSWDVPANRGGVGVGGFVAKVNGKPIPQYLVPAPQQPGGRLTMHLRDLGLTASEAITVAVAAIDEAGNEGPWSRAEGHASADIEKPLPGTAPAPFTDGGPLPRLGDVEIAIIDALDKVQPQTGQMIPPQPAGYLAANHLWRAADKRIRLDAARNEFVSFQVLFRGPMKDAKVKCAFEGGLDALQVTLDHFGDVPSRIGPVPDPLLPLAGPFSTPPGDANAGVLCEVYVPHQASVGHHAGTLQISIGGGAFLSLAIDLNVWRFALPDRLNFIPEMNCYDLPANESDYYRLAHRNRTVINRVPYHQNGVVEPGCAPAWDGKQLDWSAWDQRFGPYLDGSAFKDLPRAGAPLDVFYLPLHENWPTPIDPNYNESYWADQAFTPQYRQAFIEVSRQFAEHFNARHWNATRFQCFFNGKNNFKEEGWSRGSSPWILDEPMNFQDFWALRWFGQAFHEGVDPVRGGSRGGAQMLFRADISRPQWQRDALDGVLNYNVVAGGPFHQYHRLVMDRKARFGQIVIPYGSSNDPADSNLQPLGWCWDSWTLGADGVLPWQVIGTDASWHKAEDTCLFYPGGPAGLREPVPSIRLKAYLRGQQDAEYLALLAHAERQSQLQVGRRVRKAMALDATRKATGFTAGEDAGVIDFGSLKPQDVWKVRQQIGQALSTANAGSPMP